MKINIEICVAISILKEVNLVDSIKEKVTQRVLDKRGNFNQVN